MSKTPKNVDANGAALIISESLGTKVSPRSLARYDIPYKIVLKRKIFTDADVMKWVERQLALAPRRIGKTESAKVDR